MNEANTNPRLLGRRMDYFAGQRDAIAQDIQEAKTAYAKHWLKVEWEHYHAKFEEAYRQYKAMENQS